MTNSSVSPSLTAPAGAATAAAPGGAPPDATGATDATAAAATGPARSVSPRVGATVDTAIIHLVGDAAVKQNMFSSQPGYAHAGANMQTHLHVEAWVENTTYAKHVWIDVHVFAQGDALVHSTTLPLQYARPAGDGGDLFVLESPIYQGMVATPGSVDLRPDARLVQYRLYAELDGRVLTDGVLHECVLRADSAGH